MQQESKNMEFEQAAKTRDDIASLKILSEQQVVRDFLNGDFDVVNIIEKYEKTYIGCIEIRDSKIIGFFNYELESRLQENQEELLTNFVEQRFTEKAFRHSEEGMTEESHQKKIHTLDTSILSV